MSAEGPSSWGADSLAFQGLSGCPVIPWRKLALRYRHPYHGDPPSSNHSPLVWVTKLTFPCSPNLVAGELRALTLGSESPISSTTSAWPISATESISPTHSRFVNAHHFTFTRLSHDGMLFSVSLTSLLRILNFFLRQHGLAVLPVMLSCAQFLDKDAYL